MKEDRGGVIIVGSGQSAYGFVPPDDIPVIAVNGAIEWLSRADYFFTLDHSEANMRRIQQYSKDIPSYIALPPHEIPEKNNNNHHITYLQRVSQSHDNLTNDDTPEYWLKRWGSVLGLSEVEGNIHTGNSAYGALGLAYHMGFTKAILIGIDADHNPRIEGGVPNNLSHLPLLFQSALGQIQVVSCGKMGGIEKMNITKGIQWLRAR